MIRRIAANVVLAYGAVAIVTFVISLAWAITEPGGDAASPGGALLGTAWVTGALIAWLLPIVVFGAVLLDLALRVIPRPRLVVAAVAGIPLAFAFVAGTEDRWLPIGCLLAGLVFARLMRLPPVVEQQPRLETVSEDLPPLRL